MMLVVMGRVRAIWYLALWLAMQFYFALQGELRGRGGPTSEVAVGAALALLHRVVVRRRSQAAAARM
jgi:hypothetical protein